MEKTEISNVPIGGYITYYIKNNELLPKLIPVELKDAFFERFGDDLLNVNENEVDEFIKNSKKQ